MNILMIAAENDALPGGKVGGIGDVIRDVPPALGARGHQVTVLTPAYGAFAELPGARRRAALEVGFGGGSRHVDLYEVPGREPQPNVRHWVLEHPQFAVCGDGRIYCDDPPSQPFARDATKFALFCAAAAELLLHDPASQPDVLHLHDWHAALLLLLRRYHPACRSLQRLRCAFSIHNLALQGVRPLSGHDSSLTSWFPGLHAEHGVVVDPRWPDCINPMAVGIRLADAVHAVSPSYAEEIRRPSAVERYGFYGGEGLEGDLAHAHNENRLFGILNGCAYPDALPPAPDWDELMVLLRRQVLVWAGAAPPLHSAHFVARERLAEWNDQRPDFVLTSIGRLTEQKYRLLRQRNGQGRPVLDELLNALATTNGVYVLLGSGDPEYEQFFTAAAGRYRNFLFLRGYSDALSQALYATGDLFLMPSSFEPCGIGQMLAMRAGQPCLVHHVGGLRDTVEPGTNGFAFTGDDPIEQADNLIAALQAALELQRQRPQRWQSLRQAAAAARFRWDDSVTLYIEQLYQGSSA
ncbi:MAG: glycogen/starch synthase [Candidatus Competibacterales bacterium]|nr:glycogen/starch synthase [Candidatus Competibacterales bacterium]